MPLINCVECNKPIMVTTASCLNCGSKRPFENKVITAGEMEDMTMSELDSFRNLGGQVEWSRKEKIEVVLLCGLMGVGMYLAYMMLLM